VGDDQRYHHRLGVALEMRIRGTDSQGFPFDEATSSEDVSRGGCCFHASHEVQLGATMELEILRRCASRRSPAPFLTTGVVVRIVPLQPERFKVCIQFTGPHFPVFSSEVTSSQQL
jgi:PilZ domain-containing protein